MAVLRLKLITHSQRICMYIYIYVIHEGHASQLKRLGFRAMQSIASFRDISRF